MPGLGQGVIRSWGKRDLPVIRRSLGSPLGQLCAASGLCKIMQTTQPPLKRTEMNGPPRAQSGRKPMHENSLEFLVCGGKVSHIINVKVEAILAIEH